MPVVLIILLMCLPFAGFKEEQKKNARVKSAYKEKEAELKKLFEQKKLTPFNVEIFFRAFKQEKKFEVWARNKNDASFILLKEYEICASSGELGPKRVEGDGQVPEGFYYIDHFNPTSNFYLSLRVNYPNESDRILSNKKHPGGDIYVHGSCVTIGCIPLTDDKIKEVYLLAVEAKNAGQTKIPIHIFPSKLSVENIAALKVSKPELYEFWNSLKPGFDYFEKNKTIPKIKVLKSGLYSVE